MMQDEKRGQWLAQQFAMVWGLNASEHGFNERVREKLKTDYGITLSKSGISNLFRYGMGDSWRGAPELIKQWADILQCEVKELLNSQGYSIPDTSMEEELAESEDAREIIAMLKHTLREGDEDLVRQIRVMYRALLDSR